MAVNFSTAVRIAMLDAIETAIGANARIRLLRQARERLSARAAAPCNFLELSAVAAVVVLSAGQAAVGVIGAGSSEVGVSSQGVGSLLVKGVGSAVINSIFSAGQGGIAVSGAGASAVSAESSGAASVTISGTGQANVADVKTYFPPGWDWHVQKLSVKTARNEMRVTL